MRYVHVDASNGLPAWPSPGSDPRACGTGARRPGSAQAAVPLAGASLLAVAAALSAAAPNTGVAESAFAGAIPGAPERSELEPPELKPAIDSCLKVRALSLARVTSAGPGEPGHAAVRLSVPGRTWECIARLDGAGLLSLRILEAEELSPALAAAGPTSMPAEPVAYQRAARPPPMDSSADAAPAPARKGAGRVAVNQRDRGPMLGNPGSDSSLGFEITPLRSRGVTMKLTAGAEHQRRPETGGGLFPFVAPTAWRETGKWNLGVDLSLLEERLRYQGRRAATFETLSAAEGRAQARAEEARFDRGDTRAPEWLLPLLGPSASPAGGASSHRLDAELFRKAGVRLTAYGGFSNLAQDPVAYRTLGPSLFHGLALPAERLRSQVQEFGGRLDLKPLRFTLSQRQEQRPNRDAEKTQLKAVYGPVALSVSQRSLVRYSPGAGRRTSREGLDGRVDLSLEDRRWAIAGEGGPRRLIPSSVWMSAGEAWTTYSWLADHRPDQENTYGAGLSWSWENGDTDLSFTRGQAASRRFALAPSDAEEWSFDLSQTFYGGAWDATGYAYASSARTEMLGGGSAEAFFGGGVTANLRAERLPDASVTVALDRFEALYEGFPEGGRDQSLDLRLDLDFSKYLPERKDGAASYLTAGYYAQRALSRSQFGRSGDWDHAVFLTWGTPF